MPRCCCCDEQSEEEELKFTDDHSTSEELKFTDDHSTSCARAYKRLTFVDVRTNLQITCVYNVLVSSKKEVEDIDELFPLLPAVQLDDGTATE